MCTKRQHKSHSHKRDMYSMLHANEPYMVCITNLVHALHTLQHSQTSASEVLSARAAK